MNKTAWRFIFIAALSAHLLAIITGSELAQMISKPLLVPVLLFYFIAQKTNAGFPTIRIILALIFSWVGDVLLMFQNDSELFFMSGLICFLAAHIFYIAWFRFLLQRENVKTRAPVIAAVGLYYVALIVLLFPSLGKMTIPVLVYGGVISIMLIYAVHTYFSGYRNTTSWIIAGGGLFVISDTILAINKFYHPFEWASLLIMLSYGLAQWFLTEGNLGYLKNSQAPLIGLD